MPNVLTHGLMALKIKNHLSTPTIKRAITNYPDVYLFGSNGPDFLFYYNVWPWLDQQEAKRISAHGERMHKENINEFIDTMIILAKKQIDPQVKEIMISFISGYLTHWALDTVAHPFIFYRSGNMKGTQQYDHYRYESMIDSKMVIEVYQEQLRHYPTRKFLSMKPKAEKVVAFLVSQTYQKVYKDTLSEAECRACMTYAKQVLPVLFDPHTLWHGPIRLFEKIAYNGARSFSSHMIIGKINQAYDELNFAREVWFNPTYPNNPHNETFLELFECATGRAKVALHAFENMLIGELDTLSNVILNRSFDTDRSDGAKMVVFDNIYLK